MHLKRLQASKNYHVAKKVSKFTVLPSSGPHAKTECIPVSVFLRDILQLAKTLAEAKIILRNEFVIVDGKVVKDYKFPLGFMDLVSLPKIKKYYRILSKNGKLVPVEVESKEASSKLCKIIGKNYLKGEKMQFALHDGRTFIGDSKKEKYNVGDTLEISLPDQKVKSHLENIVGNIVMITGGKHIGSVGIIKDIEIIKSSEPNMAFIDIDGTVLRTLRDYMFVIGKTKPIIKVE